MGAYLIFAPDAEQPNGLSKELGLSEAIGAESDLCWERVLKGPGGGPGMLGFWLDMAAGSPGYRPESQRWQLVPNKKYWLGTSLDSPLLPADIARGKLCPRNHPVILEDRNTWLIPVASALPHLWGLDEKGEYDRLPKPEFADFCRQAGVVFTIFVNHANAQDSFQVKDQFEYVCRALSLNYKLCPQVISALGLLADESGGDVLAATIDLSLIQEVNEQKKTAE